MTERAAKAGVDDRLEVDRELKRSERRSQDGGSNGTTWGAITKESEEMYRALKEATELGNMAKRIFPQ